MPTDEVLLSVWNRVEAMKPGQIMVIREHCGKRKELFIECLKMWIDCFKHGEFNRDYTVFKLMNKWQ